MSEFSRKEKKLVSESGGIEAYVGNLEQRAFDGKIKIGKRELVFKDDCVIVSQIWYQTDESKKDDADAALTVVKGAVEVDGDTVTVHDGAEVRLEGDVEISVKEDEGQDDGGEEDDSEAGAFGANDD